MLFSSKSHGHVGLILEVQSSLIRSSLIWFRQGTKPEILFIGHEEFIYRANAPIEKFVETTVTALKKSIDAVLKEFSTIKDEITADSPQKDMPRHIRELHYVLSSPWIVCQARTLAMSFEHDTKVTRARVESILDDERNRLAPHASGPTAIIEQKIFDVRLNGYPVRTWEDKSARQVEISYALGVAGAGSLKHFESACHRAVSRDRIQFHSSLLLQYIGLRILMPEHEVYTLIHIHGELTDIVAVRNGTCFFFGSYPVGVHSIIQSIAKNQNIDEEAAESLLTLYLEGRLNEESTAHARIAIKKVAQEWIDGLRTLLNEGQIGNALPPHTFIVSRLHQKFFMDAFQGLYPASQIELLFLDGILPQVDFGNHSEQLRIVGLYTLAIESLLAGKTQK